MDILKLIGRDKALFDEDLQLHEKELSERVSASSFLVIGGAGSIGQAVTKEIFRRNPKKLHVVDISENNLVELVRDIRSSYGYIDGDFQTYALDIGSLEYDALIRADGHFDYVLNLSALKHVRSERDPFTLMRMIDVNIFNTEKTIQQSIARGTKKYFCVSTDKAANPVNMMGASKRIMEMYLQQYSSQISISTARFANVAFSDGSLLHGFNQRMQKRQPLVAPNDIKRYFITPRESGELCLMACVFGNDMDIFFPKLSSKLNLITFAEIAVKYLEAMGYEAYQCKNEDEARGFLAASGSKKQWPCLFSASDTTGEKDFEEFFTATERLDMSSFASLGVIKNDKSPETDKIRDFSLSVAQMKAQGIWSREQIVELFKKTLPDFAHKETGKFLDAKM